VMGQRGLLVLRGHRAFKEYKAYREKQAQQVRREAQDPKV